MTNCYKLKIGFKVNPLEEVDFYFTSIFDKSEIMSDITSAFKLGEIYLAGGDTAINMADVSWFVVEWESCR